MDFDGSQIQNEIYMAGESPWPVGFAEWEARAADVLEPAPFGYIAGGAGREVLEPILAGEPRGTRFHGTDRGLSAYKLWLRFGKQVSGRLHVDDGARQAVAAQGRSLLAVGVVECEGRFEAGDAVELIAPDGAAFARGVAAAAAAEIAERPRGIEAVHRDRLVVY